MHYTIFNNFVRVVCVREREKERNCNYFFWKWFPGGESTHWKSLASVWCLRHSPICCSPRQSRWRTMSPVWQINLLNCSSSNIMFCHEKGERWHASYSPWWLDGWCGSSDSIGGHTTSVGQSHTGSLFWGYNYGWNFDNGQKPRTENFWKAELEVDHLLFDGGVELLFTVSRKPSLK